MQYGYCVSTPGRNPPIGPWICFESGNPLKLMRHAEHASSIPDLSLLPSFLPRAGVESLRGGRSPQVLPEMGSWVAKPLTGPDRRWRSLKRDAGASYNFHRCGADRFHHSCLPDFFCSPHPTMRSLAEGKFLKPHLSWRMQLTV